MSAPELPGPELPGYVGRLDEARLRDLYGAYRTVKHAHYDGTAGYSKPELAAAWRAIMLTYPELIAAARIGLELMSGQAGGEPS